VTDEPAGRARQLPVFHCPYCGDEELTPYEGEGTAAGWRCGACLRAFSVRLIATGVQE
jgi:transposase-like protein